MSETHTSTGAGTTNGTDPAAVAKPKRKIANTTIDGSTVTIVFASGQTLTFDAKKVAPAIAPSVTAYGAAGIIQTAYNTAKDPVQAAEVMIGRLSIGDWTPGRPKADSEPDPLIVALAEHLDKPHDFVTETYLPKFAEKNGIGSVGAARRELRKHPAIAPRIAEITAERAKAAVAASKKAPARDLAI
jgi:hypothetical protein